MVDEEGTKVQKDFCRSCFGCWYLKKKKITGGKIQNKQKGILSGAALRDGIHHVGMKEGSLGCESYSLCW